MLDGQYSALIAFATFVLTVASTASVTTWAVSSYIRRRDDRWDKIFKLHELEDKNEFKSLREAITDETSAISSSFGTTLTTLRQFVNDQLLAIREEHHKSELEMNRSLEGFVRKSDFAAVVRDLKEDMRAALTEVKSQTREDITQLRQDTKDEFKNLADLIKSKFG